MQELDLVQALVQEVLVVLDHLKAHQVFTPPPSQVATVQGRTEGRGSDGPAHLVTYRV